MQLSRTLSLLLQCPVLPDRTCSGIRPCRTELSTHKATMPFPIRMLVLALLLCPLVSHAQTTVRLDGTPDVAEWIAARFAKGKQPPFSFVYNGIPSSEFLTRWQYEKEKIASPDPQTVRERHIYTDPATGLKVECDVTGFKDFHAVEWVLHFTNTSQTDTPILERNDVADLTFTNRTPGTFSLLSARGSVGSRADFMVSQRELSADSTIRLAPQGGRSSDCTAFPMFNLIAPNGRQGVMAAIGWSGGWQAALTGGTSAPIANRQAVRSGNVTAPGTGSALTLQTGMERFRLYLKPGERIRTPLVSLMFWNGDNLMTGQNKFRRFLLAHHSRQLDGKFAEYPYASGFALPGPEPCTENGCLTEEMAIAMARRHKQFNLVPEVFWLDAGWYTDSGAPVYDWCDCVGTWTPDTTRFPNGLRPLSDEAHRLGARFLLWFEPERVSRGSWLAREHQPWLLHTPRRNSALLDLGNPEALEWLCTHVGDMIEREGIDIYRQDFNHPPKPFWEDNEQPDRIGMTEIRHIEGLYTYWDYLLSRFPRLLIDNCAAGGRRIDLETLSRSAPLWRTDYPYGEVTGYQSHTYGLNFFLPQHGTGMWETDDYSTRSSLGAAVVATWDLSTRKLKVADIQRAIANFKKYRPYYYEDYYPLTGIIDTQSDSIWLAYQMHRPSDNSGIVVAFRRPEAVSDRITVRLSGIDPAAAYDVYNDNTGLTLRMDGRQLLDGLMLQIPQKRGSLLLHYTATTPETAR